VLFADELMATLQSPTIIHAFVYSTAASLAAELALFSQAFGPRGAIANKKYTSKLYWVIRVFVALFAGLLATAAFNPTLNPFVYVYLGLAMPGLLNRGASVFRGDDLSDENESDAG
jgi:hypothetical protein